jgi:cobalamin biosynthesis protein CobD/CbiB
METKNLSELSVKELMKKKITLKTVLGALMGILSLLAVGIIALFVQKQNSVALPLLVVLFSLSSIVFINKKELSNTKAELEKRDNNNDMI